MAYDGKVMRLALQRFEEDRRAREERFQERRESVFRRQPRLRQVDAELRTTMSRIITGALRHGTESPPGGGAAAGGEPAVAGGEADAAAADGSAGGLSG